MAIVTIPAADRRITGFDEVKTFLAGFHIDHEIWPLEDRVDPGAPAEAILAARRKIVLGAVDMVESALTALAERGVVHLDDDRRAAMVSNLLVVLCADREPTPVVNTGTLYG
jgi:hypothetical protein